MSPATTPLPRNANSTTRRPLTPAYSAAVRFRPMIRRSNPPGVLKRKTQSSTASTTAMRKPLFSLEGGNRAVNTADGKTGGVCATAPASANTCLLYTSDAADEEDSVDLVGS